MRLIKQIQRKLKLGVYNPKNYGYLGENVTIDIDTFISNPKNVYLYGNNG